MSYNLPTYDADNFSFGNGVLYIGATGATPTIEIGAVKGDAAVSIERTLLEVMQGSPQSLVKQYATQEKVSLKVTGIEWNMDNIAYVLGAGTTTDAPPEDILEFGGSMTVEEYALRFVHQIPTGGTIDIQLFRAQGAGVLEIAMKETDVHEFPFEFKALEGTVDFGNVALATGKKKFKIIKTKA